VSSLVVDVARTGCVVNKRLIKTKTVTKRLIVMLFSREYPFEDLERDLSK
jgi:hypothetical protein